MNLADLLTRDLATVDTDELAAGIQEAEMASVQSVKWSADMIRELRSRDISWSEMVRLTGLPQTTLWRRAKAPQKETDLPAPSTTPEHPPVVAAIVTSHLGVLAGRRNDGRPPWTFIAGKIEAGESQADAAVREVKEETGLVVKAAHQEIGRRVHPVTKKTMIYLACHPAEGTDVFVGDPEELAEVRWLSLGEVDEHMGKDNVFPPVWEHLERLLP